MNKWIVLGIVLVVGVSGYILLQNDEESVPTVQKIEPIKKQKQAEKKDIEILYLSDQRSETSGQQSKTDKQKIETETQHSTLNTQHSNLNPQLSISNSPIFTQKQEEAEKIITENALQKVTPPNQQDNSKPQKFSIYAKNSYDQIDEEKYKSMPPMVPTIITVTTPKGEKYSVVADTKIVQNNDKIYISKNDNNGNPQTLLEVPTHEDVLSNNETQNDEQSTPNSKTQENIKLIMPPAIGQ